MGLPALKPPTFDDLYDQIRALAQGVTGEILEPGVLRTMSRPGKAHRWAAQAVGHRLQAFDVRLGGAGWWIETEAEIRFPDDRLAVPDLSGFRVERVPELPDENPLTIVPDWCCEVLSPRTARDDRRLKLPLYAQSGVAWVWLVDPELCLVEVFETVSGRPVLAATGASDEQPELPPFDTALDLARWWAPRSEPTPEAGSSGG